MARWQLPDNDALDRLTMKNSSAEALDSRVIRHLETNQTAADGVAKVAFDSMMEDITTDARQEPRP